MSKHLNYFLLPLLFVAALLVFTALMFPLSVAKVANIDLISIWLIILVSVVSSLVSVMVFIFFNETAKKRRR